MRLFRGPGLPSDRIRIRFGFEGTEPDEVVSRNPPIKPSWTRVAIVLNTHYPEIQGGYYLNRSLIGLVQDGLGDLGLHVVWNEAYGNLDIIPVEERSSLHLNENYLLIDAQFAIQGSVLLWQYDVAGGGTFYSDDVVVDICIEEGLALRMKSEFEMRCRRAGVALVSPDITPEAG